ncbi:complement C2 [Thalassophryne amazonica]|uniref:complement C2 n=1 Tax=Thalassophryne amazonica TaxID=390379 RepID=UPI001470FA4C|nr:complement C2 [Thalassophryne amazonica]
MSVLWILLFLLVRDVSLQEEDYEGEIHDDLQAVNCSTTENIRGGHVTYSQWGLEDSVLTFHCGPGRYPSPVSHRLCGNNGEWSPMRLANGRRVLQATCKELLCPGQLQLNHGDFWPRDQWFRIGTVQSFSCHDGFTLSGSTQRNCTISGDWTGTAPVCDNHADDCVDPGIPPGAQMSEGRFQTGDKVTYRCQAGLSLLGSDERVCLENREWSGSAPRCQGPHTFDSPSVVAAAMAGSLAGSMDVFSPEFIKKVSYARTIHVSEGSLLNIYVLLDTSGSIKEDSFNEARKATMALITKLDSYEVQMKFHVLSFATEAKDIVDITDTFTSSDSDSVMYNLKNFDYRSHGHKRGTNLFAALHRVSEKISFFKQNRERNYFNETQNIIIIATDGNHNTGTKPQVALAQIRHLLGYKSVASDHTDETLLDVYVFGVGKDLNKGVLNSLASKKRGEQHVFVLTNYRTLGEVFNSMISDKTVTMCGIAQEDVDAEDDKHEPKSYTRPWHVTLKSALPCSGSIVSQTWVLTAAHCFARASTDQVFQHVEVTHDGGTVHAKRVILHPEYNIYALKHKNVSEFYDYDVALVELNKSIPLSWKARPICLPCTVPAGRAMKKVNSTCQQHREELLTRKATAAFFIHKKSRLQTHIQTNSQRLGCVEKALKTLQEPTNVTLDEYIPDRFLCSGGSQEYKDAITCKGDSGGSLFLQKRNRYFQVGVVSWGTTNVCGTKNVMHGYSNKNPPSDARDFHIDLFKLAPWLKEHLRQEIQFLPLNE